MPSIGVLEAHQKDTDRPSRRIKRAGGQSLVRQQRAEWLIENVLLRLLPDCLLDRVASYRIRDVYVPTADQVIDPELAKALSNGMPPAELPGIYFRGPLTKYRPVDVFA